MAAGSFRTEHDLLGDREVPADAYYGVHTLRAVENFPISGLRPLPAFVDAVVWIKRSAALTHRETGRLEKPLADAIVKEARDIWPEMVERDRLWSSPAEAATLVDEPELRTLLATFKA